MMIYYINIHQKSLDNKEIQLNVVCTIKVWKYNMYCLVNNYIYLKNYDYVINKCIPFMSITNNTETLIHVI